MLDGVKGLLTHVGLYVALQKGVGAHRLRHRSIDELSLRDGDAVLDIGCGPAYYLGRLPNVRYFGFDTSARYIAHARRRWAGRDGGTVEFRCEVFSERHLDELPPIDAVMLLGVLHHMSDDHCRDVLRLAARALGDGGRVVSVDTCFEPTQGRISRWMSDNDRGEYVREPEGFRKLAEEAFADVDGEVISDATRIPSSHWMMRMRAPLPADPPIGGR
jgi:SAM-dependent methyltransferase